MHSGSFPVQLRIATAALLLAACGGEPQEDDRTSTLPDRQGAAAVAGSSLNEWALLAVPRDGGPATVRSRTDPSEVLWESETTLPVSEETRVVDGPLVLLRTPQGEVFRFDPRTDELTGSGELADGARWSTWGAYGLFLESSESELLEIGPDGSWQYRLDSAPEWASPVEEGRVVVLVRQSDGRAVWVVRRGDDEPEARISGSFSTPALVTAWGRRLALLDGEADRLRFLTVPQLTSAGEVALGSPATALAASPSSHELYASLDVPPRLVRINRFSGSVRTVTETERTLREIRPAVLGEGLLAWDGVSPLLVPLSGAPPVRLEGEWREDLPVVVPGGAVLLVREGRLHLRPPDAGESEPVDAPADHWWAPVRWNPGPPTVVTGPIGDEPLPGERLFESGDDERERSAAWPTAAGPPEREDDREAETPGERTREEVDSLAADSAQERSVVREGFYAILISARSPAGVRQLTARLEAAGYPTAVQRHEDDAGEVWYRGMVGPFPARPGAEAAARQLRRERDLQVWVTEIRSELSAEDIFD